MRSTEEVKEEKEIRWGCGGSEKQREKEVN